MSTTFSTNWKNADTNSFLFHQGMGGIYHEISYEKIHVIFEYLPQESFDVNVNEKLTHDQT